MFQNYVVTSVQLVLKRCSTCIQSL